MAAVHNLLRRQLRRLAPSGEDVPAEWRTFVEAVDDAYLQFDEDRRMLERSLDLSSEELLQANAEMRSIFQAFPDLFFLLRADGTILDRRGRIDDDTSTSAYRHLNGKRIQDVPVPGLGERFDAALAQVLATGEIEQLEYPYPSSNGPTHWEARLVPLPGGQVVVLIRDMTERRALERQLVQAQRMEAVGRLAGGVAHDFNNLLTIILGYCEVLEDEVAGERHNGVAEIVRAAERAAELTRQLLAFGRKQLLQPEVLDLNDVVGGLSGMLDRLIGEDIRVTCTLAADLGRVRADSGQLEQVVVNLAVNARDAMSGKGGSLHLETRNVTLRQRCRGERSVMEPGDYAVLRVSDTGCGMDAVTRSRLFEPFFTTKPVGHGTGLGLATVYGIVKQSGGHVWAESELGAGSTLEVFLPRLAHDPGSTTNDEVFPGVERRRHRGSGTVLLLEDEDALRHLLGGTLRRHGYDVLEARTSREALRLADEHRSEIDLLLTDVVLPDHPGTVAARILRRRQPSLRVLLMSGYPGAELHRRGAVDDSAGILQKPFSRRALLSRVEDLLSSRSEAAAVVGPPQPAAAGVSQRTRDSSDQRAAAP